MVITGRAVLVAAPAVPLAWASASLAGPIWIGPALLTGALLLAVAVDMLAAANPRRLALTRSGDTVVRLGEEAAVLLEVANPAGRTLRAVVRDAWPPSAGARPRRRSLTVPPGQRRYVTTALAPQRRGFATAAGVTVRSLGPLGLAARQCTHDVGGQVRVMPPFDSRRHLPEKLARLRELDGRHRALVRGQGSEFDSLREYTPGDDVRSIDWRATARADTVVVRTWRPERDRRILVALDTSRTSAGRVADTPRLDHAIDAALLLATLAARAGDRVELLAFDRRVRARVPARRRATSVEPIARAMAPLEPELVELDASGLVSTLLSTHRQRQLVVLLTDLDPAALEEGLLPRLPALTSRHVVLLAAVGDPRVAEMAAGRGDAAAAYEAAAAERTRTDRRRVTAELRRHGVEVVDADPEGFASALADAYLQLKAAGRL